MRDSHNCDRSLIRRTKMIMCVKIMIGTQNVGSTLSGSLVKCHYGGYYKMSNGKFIVTNLIIKFTKRD